MKKYTKDIKKPSSFTEEKNKAVLSELPFDNKQDYVDAKANLVVAPNVDAIIDENDGHVVYNFKQLEVFNTDVNDAPTSVNPSLWRQAQLTKNAGIYEVVPGKVYQARDMDIANVIFIRTDNGWVVSDTTMTVQAGAFVLEQFRNSGIEGAMNPIKAIIYTHSHIDHFGGVRAFVTEEEIAAGNVQIIAPYNFSNETISENVYAGNAMSRRTTYQGGTSSQFSACENVGAGLGISISRGDITLINPTTELQGLEIELMTIDGLEIIFSEANETEAPSETVFYVPEYKYLNMAEVATHTNHNLLTLRGAKIRSSLKFAKVINRVINKFSDVEVIASQHHWPTYGNEACLEFLKGSRDLYKAQHDITLNLINQGVTIDELPHEVKLPTTVANKWANRGYYGHLSHNVKAIYQYYLGNFDGVPAHLEKTHPVQAGKNWTELLGGAEAAIMAAEKFSEKADYQFASEILNAVVFGDPTNEQAKLALADAYEAIGYTEESGIRRNWYITGANELRNGVKPPAIKSDVPDLFSQLTIDQMLDMLAYSIDHHALEGLPAFEIEVFFEAEAKTFNLEWSDNQVLNHFEKLNPNAVGRIEFASKMILLAIAGGKLTPADAMKAGLMKTHGDITSLNKVMATRITFDSSFNIVTP